MENKKDLNPPEANVKNEIDPLNTKEVSNQPNKKESLKELNLPEEPPESGAF